RPEGATLAAALRGLWGGLHVEETLEGWSAAPAAAGGQLSEAVHRGAWEQLQAWADGLALGFGEEPQPLSAWLPVLETGLAALTAGVIPPAQDQVLVGAVDRARQPELRLVILAGFNDGLFPAAPSTRGLLTERERDALAVEGLALGPALRRRLGHERYYAYIALTRARARLVITYSRRDAEDRALNPSPYLAPLRRLFPALAAEDAPGPCAVGDALHPAELAAAFVADPALAALLLPVGAEAARWRRLAGYRRGAALAPALAARLAGPVLRTSATRLEDFARCPFRFFAAHLLAAAPREILEADPRREGTLRHE
ncbi:MAG TPA: PD-(D/E)XK nuclease family protein, partial [Verrucomicrobiota bacterium]|nr:PD-(D/E)XK nuclease family protein [Verrucomicrobiota bacterium]